MFADGRLGASFFCSRDFEDRSNLQAIFPTLAYQLAFHYPLFRDELLQVLKGCPDARKESLCSQMERFIVGPLQAAHISTLIIIDALDECKDEEPASAILSILSRYMHEIPDVKFFITGRPEPRIQSGFRLRSLLPITEVFKLHGVKPEAVNNDVKLYFQTQLTDLAETQIYFGSLGDWPNQSDVEILCRKAAGFFIYASTVVKFVASVNYPPAERLTLLTSLPQTTSEEGKSGIDQLYIKVLEYAFHDVHNNDIQFYPNLRSILGTVLLIFNPLSVKGLSELLKRHQTPQFIFNTICSLRSVLVVPDNMEDPILTFHKSFPDFLTDPERCKDKLFLVDPAVHHMEIFFSCLDLMEERLKKNICRLDDYAVLSEVQDFSDQKKYHVGDALEYACCFWTKHLLKIPGNSPDIKKVQRIIDRFSTTYLLFWIEALSLMGSLGVAVYALNDIQQWCMLVSYIAHSSNDPAFMCVQAGISCEWVNDTQHLLLGWFDAICESPSQIYHSALPLSPSSSWVRNYHSAELSGEVKVVKGLPTKWGTCFRTVALYSDPESLACWKDTIAAGLDSGEIITLDGTTGSQTAILSGHTGWVISLVFSSDGTSLLSGSRDQAIKLWDMQTGGVIKSFYGHTDEIVSVSISADCTTIASGSGDGEIRLWKIQTGECHHTIQQRDRVGVSFSPIYSQYLVSVSGGKINQWDIDGSQIRSSYDGSHVAFSSDGTQLVLCQNTNIVVQSSNSGAIMAKFQIPNSTASGCYFSPDGRLVAITADDTVYIWDITGSDPHLIEILVGHNNNITSLVFSSSSTLVTSSWDKLVKFWQVGVMPTDKFVGPKTTPIDVPPIKSTTLQAKNGIFVSHDSGGIVKTWDISTGLCKTSLQTPAKDNHQSDVRLVNDRFILVWYADEKIHIWDVGKEKLLQEIHSNWHSVHDIRISGDGTKVFCLSEQSIKAWSISTGELVNIARLGFSMVKMSLIVDNSSRVWVHYHPKEECPGWDFGIPDSSPSRLHDTSSFHLSDTKLWDVGLSRIKDISTGKVILQLGGRSTNPVDVQLDGGYLLVRYESGEALILDFNHMLLQ